MEIYAKASLDENEIKEKIRCGCNGIEFNLTYDFYKKGNDFLRNYPNQIYKMYDVRVVHAPSTLDGCMMNLEHIFMHRDPSALENVFRLAQYCGETWNHRIILVIHCSLSMYDFMEYEILRERIIELLDIWLERYPLVDMAIENVICLEYKGRENVIPRLCNGVSSDIPEISAWIEKKFPKRIGTVLDTCHAMMTKKYMGCLLREADITGGKKEIDYSLENYFKANKSLCKLIHLNSFKRNGYLNNHGTPFDNPQQIEEILRLYFKYQYKCPITLEIRENDYTNCINYRETKKTLEGYLERIM